jgi:N-acetyl-gamma-glutamyl-phosphate/LysW-gamma-L-alpha-aminoadipyl-6-phosphate reductase
MISTVSALTLGPRATQGPHVTEPQVRAAIVGGSGYTGGELARLLLNHPRVQLSQIVSSSHAGKYLHHLHPNLRPAGGRPAVRLMAPASSRAMSSSLRCRTA